MTARAATLEAPAAIAYPCFSNRADCERYRCPATPWNWASRWVPEQAKLSGRELVCDLGAGQNPIVLKALAAGAREAYLVDNLLLPERGQLPPNVKAKMADITSLPFEADSFDVVISISVLEHLPQEARRLVFAEIERVLRPGGRAVLSIGNIMLANEHAQELLRTMPFFTRRNCAAYLPIDLADLLVAAPQLRPADGELRVTTLGGDSEELRAIAADASLVFDAMADYPDLAEIPALRRVVVCEAGLHLVKLGQPSC